MPAAGWIGKLYRSGEKLIADFIDIPQKIYQLIENRAYRKVSSEIYMNIEVNGKKYPKLLGGVALLGADTPGVMNLTDILGMYGLKNFETMKKYSGEKPETKIIEYNNPQGKDKKKMELTALEAKLQMDLDEQKALFTVKEQEAKKALEEKEALEKEAKDLRTFKANSEAETKRLQAEKVEIENKAKVQKFISDLKEQKLVTKAMEPLVEALVDGRQDFTINNKKFESKQDVLLETLKLFKEAAKVNFVENSEDGDKDKDKPTEAMIVEKINKYAAEKKVSPKQARKELGLEIK